MQPPAPKLALFHPFAFALLPIVSLISHNIDGSAFVNGIRPLIAALLLTIPLLLLFKVVVKDWSEASLLASLALILFFSYGHVYLGLLHESTASLFFGIGLVGRHELLAPVWLGFAGLGGFAIHRLHRLHATLTRLFTFMAIAAMAVPLFSIVSHEIQLSKPWSPKPLEVIGVPQSNDEARPDIYYIILDGYGRADILQDFFHYDNSEFLTFLRDQGFYIADQSRSNYIQTSLSMSSALNMSYLDSVAEIMGEGSGDRTPLARLIRWSEVRRLLEDQGYTIVAFSTGYRLSELENADLYLRAPLGAPTTLERLSIDTSGLVLAHDLLVELGMPRMWIGYQAHRNRVQYTFDHLVETAEIAGPKFVFAHILVPHPPFVFGSHGEQVEQIYPFTLMDGDAYLGTQEEYVQGYRDQLAYVNQVMEGIIPAILAKSDEPPLILLQGDHGPGSRLDWASVEGSDLAERPAILNAYYLPGLPPDVLYESISPVNSFRLVFDHYFGTKLGLLPDKSHYSSFEQPYLFIPIE